MELRMKNLPQDQSQVSQTHSQSQSQQSMMGANHMNDFKDGQTNVVHNLRVHMSPNSAQDTRAQAKKSGPGGLFA